MATKKIIVVEKTPGKKIAYEVQKSKLIFGDDELSVNLASRERDYEVTLDICIDTEDGIVIGGEDAMREYTTKEMKLLKANPYTYKVTKKNSILQLSLRKRFGRPIRRGWHQERYLKILDMTLGCLDKSRQTA